jgi:hypothetical protein
VTDIRDDRPIWLKALERVSLELRKVEFPARAEDGLRMTLSLADFGWRQILHQVRHEQPGASDEEIAELAYRRVCDWQSIRDKLRFRPAA